jgi:hypothetical protein
MKNEINKTHYCAGDFYSEGCFRWNENDPYGDGGCKCILEKCICYHRKWTTPEQYKAEYGEEWPEENAVYYKPLSDDEHWDICSYGKARYINAKVTVCACTPWGKPPDDFVPEEVG